MHSNTILLVFIYLKTLPCRAVKIGKFCIALRLEITWFRIITCPIAARFGIPADGDMVTIIKIVKERFWFPEPGSAQSRVSLFVNR